MISPEERAVRVLIAMGGVPETKVASGRYVRARDSRVGVRLWATTQQRFGQDLAGVQFYGRGRAEGERLAAVLKRHGFIQRAPQAGQLTFAMPVDYADDGGVDTASVAQVRHQIDNLISGATTPATKTAPASFRDAMLASPLAEVELPEMSRSRGWRGETV